MSFRNFQMLLITATIVAFSLTISACNNSGKGTEKGNGKTDTTEQSDVHQKMDMEHENMDEQNEGKEDADLPMNVSKEDAKTLTDGYLKIKDDLVKSDAATASKDAQNLLMSSEKMKGGEGLEAFNKHLNMLAGAKDLESAREVLSHLSEHIYMLAQQENVGMTVYKQYCPMAFHGKGAFWMSIDTPIMNPYFGDKMLHCGTTQETIAQK